MPEPHQVHLHEDSGPWTKMTWNPPNGVSEGRKLILCFDGTGNAFSGSNADTNVVKLLNKLDRNDPNQFHYYQSIYDPSTSCLSLLLIGSDITSWYWNL